MCTDVKFGYGIALRCPRWRHLTQSEEEYTRINICCHVLFNDVVTCVIKRLIRRPIVRFRGGGVVVKIESTIFARISQYQDGNILPFVPVRIPSHMRAVKMLNL